MTGSLQSSDQFSVTRIYTKIRDSLFTVRNCYCGRWVEWIRGNRNKRPIVFQQLGCYIRNRFNRDHDKTAATGIWPAGIDLKPGKSHQPVLISRNGIDLAYRINIIHGGLFHNIFITGYYPEILQSAGCNVRHSSASSAGNHDLVPVELINLVLIIADFIFGGTPDKLLV